MGLNRARFIDKIRLIVRAGNGGKGGNHFTRLPGQNVVPPDGGRGGDGGSVYVKAARENGSLDLSASSFQAEYGLPGGLSKLTGRRGKDLEIEVPMGTVVWEVVPTASEMVKYEREVKAAVAESKGDDSSDALSQQEKPIPLVHPKLLNLENSERLLVAELNTMGQRTLLAKGGRGGLGNASFKSSMNRSPIGMRGGLGQVKVVELELKTIADVGLVGLPNAGKSTFLRAISDAKPKIAPYPFTTLHPNLGVVRIDQEMRDYLKSSLDSSEAYPELPNEHDEDAEKILTYTTADIPGIIDGSHQNKGLGFGFLRHIERTRVLAYVVDVSPPEKDRTPIADLKLLLKELELYQPGLSSSRKGIVLANKMDSLSLQNESLEVRKLRTERIQELAEFCAVELDMEMIPLSAKYRQNVLEAKWKLWKLLREDTGGKAHRRQS